MRYLDGIGDCESAAWDINNRGQVIGTVYGYPGYYFLWENGIVTDLGFDAYGINNAGQVVGGLAGHAALWEDGTIIDLGTLGGHRSVAFAINDAGQVVGFSYDAYGNIRAFSWDSTHGMTDLGPGYAWAINDASQVVGEIYPPGDLPFYWDSTVGMILLSDLLPPNSGWQRLSFASDINNRGQIVGTGTTDIGEYHVFLMTPVSEPAIEAAVDIDPDTLNLSSKGKWITCYIWLPEGYDVVDIDHNSVLLGGEIVPEWLWCDEEEQVVMARFNRSEVQGILDVGKVELTTTGELTDGTIFEGTDVIRVIDKGGGKAAK